MTPRPRLAGLLLPLTIVTACALPHARTRAGTDPDAASPMDAPDAIADRTTVEADGAAIDDGTLTMDAADTGAATDVATDTVSDAMALDANDPRDAATDSAVVTPDVAVDAARDASEPRDAVADTMAPDASGCPAGQFDCGDGRCRPVVATVSTCRDATADGVHVLTVGGQPWCSHCRTSGMGPRWTLVLRVNGSRAGGRDPARFRYDSPYWTDSNVYQPWELDVTDDRECKLRGFFAQPFTELRMVLNTTDRATGGELIRGMGGTVTSLRAVFAGGANQYASLWTSRNMLDLVTDTRLQGRTTWTGFNVRSDNDANARVRIGAIGDESNPSGSPDSYLGLGGALPQAATTPAYSAGNVATFNGGNDREIPLYGLLWIR